MASEWQPINTAPKDGTRVLLLWRNRVYIGAWSDEAQFEQCERRPGWQVFDCNDCWYSMALDTEVTDWMPLPQGRT